MQVIVTSERDPARWVGDALAFAARRFGALALALMVLAAAAWLAPRILNRTPDEIAVEPAIERAEPLVRAGPLPPLVEPVVTETPAPAPVRARPNRRSGIPLDVPHEAATGDDFDVLSAPELDAISQAKPE